MKKLLPMIILLTLIGCNKTDNNRKLIEKLSASRIEYNIETMETTCILEYWDSIEQVNKWKEWKGFVNEWIPYNQSYWCKYSNNHIVMMCSEKDVYRI